MLFLVQRPPPLTSIEKPRTASLLPQSNNPLPGHRNSTVQPPQPPSRTQLNATTHTTTQKLTQALHGSIAPSTRRKYDYETRKFTRFCDTENRQPLPASEETLCLYAAQGVGRLAGTTARNAISAIRAWHIDSGHQWNSSARLSRVLRGVECLAPPESMRPPRPAVTAEMVATLVRHLNIADPKDAAIAAAAATALWGQARLIEILPISATTFDDTHVPRRSDLGILSPSRRSRPLHLPFTKVRRQKGETVTITNQSGLANPLPLLANHLDVNHLPSNSPLFAFTSESPTGFTMLSKGAFMARCNAIWALHGHPRFTGHSFRIGGTTELLAAGVPPDVVKKSGRWASDSFLRYWRKDAALGERHIADVAKRARRRLT